MTYKKTERYAPRVVSLEEDTDDSKGKASYIDNNSRLQCVAHRGILPGFDVNDGSNNYILGESYFKAKVGKQRVSDIRLVYSGYYLNTASSAEEDNDAALTVNAAIEQASPNRVHKAYTKSGFDIVVPAGIGHVITEPVGIMADAHELITIQTSIEMSAGDAFPLSSGLGGDATRKYFSTSATSQVGELAASWVATSRTAATYMYGPTAILGIPEKPFPSVFIIGDSIADGAGDTSDNQIGDNGGLGWICRGLWNIGDDDAVIPWIRMTKPGDAANTYKGGIRQKTLSLMQYCSHVICQVATNDIAAPYTLEVCQANLTATWAHVKARGKHLTQCLVMPKTTSTDSWATLANQSYATGCEPGGVRDQLNAWIKSQVGILIDDIIDPNPYVESQTDHGKWIVNGSANYPTTDGTHPSTAIHILAAQAVTAWAEQLPDDLDLE